MTGMKKAQLFTQDILFALVIVIFVFSLWLILRDRVLTMISTSEDKRQIDEAASNALSQLVESAGVPSNWNTLYPGNETTIGSLGLMSDRNVLDSAKLSRFVRLAGGHSSSLAALWRFDEGSGTTVYDSSGNGNTGTFNNNPAWVPGRFGEGLQFHWGSTEHVAVNDSKTLDITGNLTIEFWYKQSVILYVSQWFLNKENSGTMTNSNYMAYLDGNNYLICLIANGTSSLSVTSTAAMQANLWYHIACTADGSNLKLYINGVLDNYTNQSITPVANSYPLLIGAKYTGDVLDRFNGTIDEVAIYSRAKSAAEIAADYTDEIPSEQDYTSVKMLLGLERASYNFNFSVSYLNGTSIYALNYAPSTSSYNASYAITNTTASIDRFALLNNSLVKLTIGVWIE
jgi:hypothetical protein